jgi:hypothetical protein
LLRSAFSFSCLTLSFFLSPLAYAASLHASQRFPLTRTDAPLPFIEFLTWINVQNSNLTWAWNCIPSNEHNALRKRNGMKTCSGEGFWPDPRQRTWLEWNWWKWFTIQKTWWTKNVHVSRNCDWLETFDRGIGCYYTAFGNRSCGCYAVIDVCANKDSRPIPSFHSRSGNAVVHMCLSDSIWLIIKGDGLRLARMTAIFCLNLLELLSPTRPM